MKLCELKIISQYISNYKKIYQIKRVSDTIIMILFEKGEPFYFNLQRGDSYIFKTQNIFAAKSYTAPFDIVLQKRFTNAQILKIDVPKEDKILQIKTALSTKYKSQVSILQLEFTGRHTNAIILDEEFVIQEALRHIDKSNSYREVKVGVKLLDLPKQNFKYTPCKIDDIDWFLKEEYQKRERRELDALKRQKIAQIDKKIKKFQSLLERLEDEDELISRSKKLEYEAGLILSNIHNIKNYQTSVTLNDYDAKPITITLPKESQTPANAANMMFQRAKKLKQKAQNMHIEKDNLTTKIEFLKRLKQIINDAKSSYEIDLYLPKQSKKRRSKESQNSHVEYFFYKDYKIGVGKNQKGNIKLLKEAKMSDIWLHLKDIPSTHVIIRTNKTKVDDEVLEFAAKLCVNFSTSSKGDFIVDYTQRKNVRVREGAKVNYTNYKSLKIRKD
jgi:predicted ribosome quality control (RQC) complex YloA/Tae2 family protein